MTTRRSAVWMLLLATALTPGRASAGIIRGQIQGPPVAAAPAPDRNPYAGRANALAQPRVPARGAATDAVIYIEALPASVDSLIPAPRARPRLTQQGQSFVPRVIAVSPGETVDFPNLDPIYHSVFSVSPVKRFDLGRYAQGKSKSVRFAKPGLVNVYCDIHANMEGFVLVAPSRALARPDEGGRYSLPDLPPGRYTVLAWHPDAAPIRREVTVPENGDVTLDLSFAR